MSDNTSLKAVSRHLPLIRGPLLLNNIICLALSVICSLMDPLYQAQLVFIAISSSIGIFDFIRYNIKKRALRQGRTDIDQEVHTAGSIIATDGILSVALLIVWIAGLIKSSRHGLAFIIATFGAFIAWSFHVTSFCAQMYLRMKFGQRAIRKCPNCDHDLNIPASTHKPDFRYQNELPSQPHEPDTYSSSLPEYDDLETDFLIVGDDKDNS